METLIRAALDRGRATIILFFLLLLGGYTAYQVIPKESNPDVAIPMMYITMTLEGISPEDAERLLVRPMEQELWSLEGIEEMTSTAGEGFASVMIEFDAGFDPRRALQDVREKVDIARAELPVEADEPRVHEINVALFPVLSIALSGPVAETELIHIARRIRDEIEAIPQVLEVDIGGDREDLLEIVVDPQVLESYNINYEQLFSLVARNNRLIAAGSLDTGVGQMPLKVPGVIETLEDVYSIPVKVEGDRVVTFGDAALLRRTFKDPTGFARIDGQPAIVLEVSKRVGANIIETIDQVKLVMEQARRQMPEMIQVEYIMDQSEDVRGILEDLLNNVLTAVVLVLILIIATMGARSAVMVGLSIPGAFLTGILMIWAIGYTMNIIVLFSLILVAGMLVDGAIVVSELADRHLREGRSPKDAWIGAATRMSWPIISSTATTLAVFIPLLFWPGVVGEFMKYLPATVILCLLASLAMALIFLPTMGGFISGRRDPEDHPGDVGKAATESRAARRYRAMLGALLRRPGLTLMGMLALIVLIYAAYARFNHGVDFFPDVEPETLQLHVRARGDLSVHEKDALLKRVEERLLGLPEVESLYARSFATPQGQLGTDVIGVIQFQLIDWHDRRRALDIVETMRERAGELPGMVLEFREQEQGPGQGKPVQLQVRARDPDLMQDGVTQIRQIMNGIGGFVDIEDDRTLPGIEWRLKVDREEAARLGADVVSVGNAVQLVTNGLMLATYRPEDATDEVDIRVRLPGTWRSMDQIARLTVNTSRGQVPLSHFVELVPAQKTGTLKRVDGVRTITIQSDIAPGHTLDALLDRLRQHYDELPDGVRVEIAGEDEDQREAAQFLTTAFVIALLLMTLILVIQFNNVYETLLVLSAIVFSTAGVLLGLLINVQPFGIVMVGMGIIALAGIVVNNNIILIDTYNVLRREGMTAYDAALETGTLRLRPVLLTAVTTVLGLMPMVLGVNVNLLEPSLGIGAPSTQWWTQLSSAIAGGLTFATALTLLLTPCMLVLGDGVFGRKQK